MKKKGGLNNFLFKLEIRIIFHDNYGTILTICAFVIFGDKN